MFKLSLNLELSRPFSIGLTGAVLPVETAEIFFQNHPSLLFLQLSNRSFDKPGFRRLGAQYDVSIFLFNKLYIVYAIIVIGYLGHVL